MLMKDEFEYDLVLQVKLLDLIDGNLKLNLIFENDLVLKYLFNFILHIIFTL